MRLLKDILLAIVMVAFSAIVFAISSTLVGLWVGLAIRAGSQVL